jgi:hypothetical protein
MLVRQATLLHPMNPARPCPGSCHIGDCGTPNCFAGRSSQELNAVLDWCVDIVRMQFRKVTNSGFSEVKSWDLD